MCYWEEYGWLQNKVNFFKLKSLIVSAKSDVNKNKPNRQNICEKVKFDKDLNYVIGYYFFTISISKVMVSLKFSGFLQDKVW